MIMIMKTAQPTNKTPVQDPATITTMSSGDNPFWGLDGLGWLGWLGGLSGLDGLCGISWLSGLDGLGGLDGLDGLDGLGGLSGLGGLNTNNLRFSARPCLATDVALLTSGIPEVKSATKT